MTNKYESQCWYCGSQDIERLQDYVSCRSCGGTWNEVPKSAFDPMAEHGSYLKDNEGYRVGKIRHPSESAFRAAAKARAQKAVPGN